MTGSTMRRRDTPGGIERMKKSFELYDTVRVDHFRAFAEYYSIPCDAENASAGSGWKALA